ncbi:MAG: PQQ-binding-like beta-propeller repeat protein, partial [Candidatus Heimdallarchaeota archaeon]|nr:PQQ-binding-like beta-propeller repeat protein [Candidatus Heimdallarchaeota archaeon]
MKKLIALSSLFFILFLNSCAVKQFGIVPVQEGKEPLVDAKTISLPHTFDSLPDLNAVEYDFNYKIERRILDSVKKEFLIVGTDQDNRLREKPIFLFKLETGEISWNIQSLTPKFTVNFSYEIPDIVIFEGSNKVFAISRQTGAILWQRTGNYTPLNISNNLAYSKQRNAGKTQMEAFDFTNGLTLWKRGGFKYGWWANSNQILENNIWLAAGDGLHTFDLKTGNGWDYEVDTDAIGGMGRVVALHILSALVGGVTTASADRYDGLTSNALVISDKVYYAGNRVLVCVDLDSGKEVWNTKVQKIAARSILFEEEDKI